MYVCDNMMHLFCTYCIEIALALLTHCNVSREYPLVKPAGKNGQLAFKMQNTAQANTEIDLHRSTKDQHRIPPAESFKSFEKGRRFPK